MSYLIALRTLIRRYLRKFCEFAPEFAFQRTNIKTSNFPPRQKNFLQPSFQKASAFIQLYPSLTFVGGTKYFTFSAMAYTLAFVGERES